MAIKTLHIIGILLGLSLLGGFQSCRNGHTKDQFNAPRTISAAMFHGSASCRECHETEYDLWMGSHHQLAMQLADSLTVLGDFNDTWFESKGIRYHFFRKGPDFVVNTEGEGGIYRDYVIKYTFGFTPLQQYIIEFEQGNKQCLLVAWDSDSLKWFDLQPSLEIHPSEWMHWTGGSMTWNNMCADCHSTYLEKNYDAVQQRYDTRYTEINVGCEACHGPGDRHNEYYQNEDKYKAYSPPAMHMPAGMTSVELVQVCARCHSRRSMFRPVYDYSGQYLDHYYPNLIQHPTYEKDGQILDEDYVYGSFLQSKMYHNKVSCRDCHDMHSMKLRKDGNALCLQCHLPKYNSYEHHYHQMDTPAADCVNCHMVGRYYMGNDFRRDHSFRNPRPDQSLVYGTPNACNGCHTDKDARWASDFILSKYGPTRPDHFSDRFLAGQDGNLDSLKVLIAGNRFPEIIRASAIQPLANRVASESELNWLVGFLKDSSAMVRREVAANVIHSGMELNVQMEQLLEDPVRSVRILAARYFILNNIETAHPGLDLARKEYFTELEVNADFASGQHQWALHYQANGETGKAAEAYRKALEIDNYYNVSRMNLALLEFERGNTVVAENLYRMVTQQEPDYAYPWFMLGLLYNETGQDEQSLESLAQACAREPLIIRAHYNYALKLQQRGEFKKAGEVLDKALATDPENESLLYVKLLGQINSLDKSGALKTAKVLAQTYPENQGYQGMVIELEKKLADKR